MLPILSTAVLAALITQTPHPPEQVSPVPVPHSIFWVKLCESEAGGGRNCVALYSPERGSERGVLIKTHRTGAKDPREAELGRRTIDHRKTSALLKASLRGVVALAGVSEKWLSEGVIQITLDAPIYEAELHFGNAIFRVDFENLEEHPCSDASSSLLCQFRKLMSMASAPTAPATPASPPPK